MLEIIFSIIETLVLIATIFWEPLKVFKDEQTAFQWFVISQFALLFAYLIARSGAYKKVTAEATQAVLNSVHDLSPRLSHNTVVLRQDEFYNDFREQISRSKFSVDISHLDTHAPDEAALPGTATESYYDQFVKLLRKHHGIRFRRVERVSLGKRDWIKRLICEMTDRPNCSLACLPIRDKRRKLPVVSVQIIDAQKAYLVAICEHVDAHAARDICISDIKAATLWLRYYDEMLWGPALKIVEDGKLNEGALATLNEEFDRLEA